MQIKNLIFFTSLFLTGVLAAQTIDCLGTNSLVISAEIEQLLDETGIVGQKKIDESTSISPNEKGSSKFTEQELSDFTSDGCSMFAEGLGILNMPDRWLKCCYDHDRTYYAGGTSKERLKADKKLRQCVIDVGFAPVAHSMYLMVRAFGTPYFFENPAPYRWGYGWPPGRDYAPLTKQEKSWVKKKIIKA